MTLAFSYLNIPSQKIVLLKGDRLLGFFEQMLMIGALFNRTSLKELH